MTFRRQLAASVVASFAILALAACSPKQYPVAEKSMTELAADFAAGKVTSEAITAAYIARIKTEDKKINSVLALNPKALEEAKAADQRRAAGKSLGPLDGMPILLKDNIDYAGMPTTAGSLALKDNIPAKDAPMTKQLRDAGMVILGKANLSEWANFRSNYSTAGWTGVAGLTRNPYDLARTASGSSSGSGAAAAASMAAVTIGTETNGSVTGPSTVNGIVGLKPTVGLV